MFRSSGVQEFSSLGEPLNSSSAASEPQNLLNSNQQLCCIV